MNRLVLWALVLIGVCVAAQADPPPANPNADVLRYTFRLVLNDQNDEVIGETSIAVRFLADGVSELRLDLVGMTVLAVQEDGQPATFARADNGLRITLRSPSKAAEQRTYTVFYRGVPADGLTISKNRYGDRTFFADHWPNRARFWLPTVDDPRDKAACDFVVTAPARYQVVANGLLTQQTDLPGGLRLTRWSEAVPIPTKAMALAVARFAVETQGECHHKYAADEAYPPARPDRVTETAPGPYPAATRQGHSALSSWPKGRVIPVQFWVYPQDRDAGLRDFSDAMNILQFFEDRLGPFPYEKLANVEAKCRYGGMENAGAIFYDEGFVADMGRYEDIVPHEVAHQWFGDSVTEGDWHHFWLSEGFATYLDHVYIGATRGRARMDEMLKKDREVILAYSRMRPRSPIVDTTITDLPELLNPNSYQKGAWVLHMLRRVVGEKAFWDGLRAYYARYRDRNALTEDFQKVMEEVSGRELSWFFREWIYQPGQPRYRGTWHYDPDARRLIVRLDQVQTNGVLFKMPVDLGIYAAGKGPTRIEVLHLNEKTNTFTFSTDAAPSKVVLDPDTWVLMEADFQKN